MSELADRSILALRENRDELADQVRHFSADDLNRPSGSSAWDVAQVLSHLGSGAEIGLDGLNRALAGEASAPPDFNQGVWDRWNAMTQQQKADGFLESTELLLSTYEAMDAQTRADLNVDLGFLPAPVGIDVLTGMRLNEALLHAWDVRVAFDPAATIPGHLAAVLVEQLSGPVSFFLRFLGKPAAVDGLQFTLLVQTSDPALQFGLECTDRVSITDAPQDADDVIHMPTEAFVRLLSGRLTPDHTPVGIAVDSSRVSLDSLRAVFPGF